MPKKKNFQCLLVVSKLFLKHQYCYQQWDADYSSFETTSYIKPHLGKESTLFQTFSLCLTTLEFNRCYFIVSHIKAQSSFRHLVTQKFLGSSDEDQVNALLPSDSAWVPLLAMEQVLLYSQGSQCLLENTGRSVSSTVKD